ncbi:MAG: hypothetical protein UY83_C0006G0042 [Candidatus Adlerbacteria bacterium GW2011_GWA1_54_10]|uniref:Uncharacterized protein n=3 Tax=Candidatus Adleribacteriota TaxID=1752736 RepID=A0A0G1XXC2_9BACT|nr:MAG: hypothetical protein UY83_C0006G0042 [Candidatus Adlerbacteria bacterium GW2011_GWA1_54_10]KKW37706.1 MAG: hypothetical protein UY86_C0004G0035 [Candidatus Adlerbacteria bacterium GW2011_GWB1_54_7]
MMKKKSVKRGRKVVTLDSLAIMVQKGFVEARDQLEEHKVEFKQFKESTNKSLFKLHSQTAVVNQRLGNIEKVLGPWVYVIDALKVNFRDHELRIARLERNAGLKK